MYVVRSKGNDMETKATPFQGIATMTYTRSHTRPSQKDLGCVVYPPKYQIPGKQGPVVDIDKVS
jgi:hypothetical protein